jgi:predicted ester cyclase
MSSVEERKAQVRDFYAAADRQDIAAITTMVSPNFRAHFAGMPEGDLAAYKGLIGMFYAALPDVRHEILDLIGEEDRVAVRLRVLGTHQGELMGVPASGNSVDFAASSMFRFDGDTIAEQLVTADMLSMLKQIGAIPSLG